MTLRGQKQRTSLSFDEQASMICKYKDLPREARHKSRALRSLCAAFGVSKGLPAKLVRKVEQTSRLVSRKGVGGRPERVSAADASALEQLLVEHAYSLTFAQISELSGIPSTTVKRFFKTNGWRLVSKGLKPYLTENNLQARFAWARKHKNNKWKRHVDIDEKWFYVYSHSGKLKLPPGHQKPRQPIKSKRFIGKVMMLIAISRPSTSTSGLIGCWRVTGDHVYKRKTTRKGIVYDRGHTRRVDVSMDAEKWVEMMKNDVVPAIRRAFPDDRVVSVQWDNATPHTAASTREIEQLLTDNNLRRVQQCPNSPDTNALDLGFNKSLDSRLPRVRSFDLDLFEQQIMQCFEEYPPEKLDDLFDMKQRVCRCIIECDPPGGNSFKLPHRRKSD